MKNNNKEFFSRNAGLISDAEQEKLSLATVAIAGAGGDGGLLAERLVRFGIGNIILADPEAFEPANINRQFAANQNTFGRNKAEAVADELRKINPGCNIKVYNKGIAKENVNEIARASDVIVDEIEYSIPSLSVMLHREARKNNKYVFMGANLGWGASAFCFAPDGKTFEEHFEYDEEHETINPIRYLKSKPEYFSEEQIGKILCGEMTMPALSSSVAVVASMLSTEIILFITRKRKPVIVPQFISLDLFDLSINKI